jgi:CRISPR system Cascade subunit CasA
MTNYSFNLIDRKWIWAEWRKDSRRELIGLQTALTRAHELREIHGDTPPETAALHRLLLVVLCRVFNPDEDWGNLWRAGEFDARKIEEYFRSNKIYGRFDLFDAQNPFFQLAHDAPAWTKYKMVTISNLRAHYASGNDAVLFDHRKKDAGLGYEADDEEGGTMLTAAEAARALVAQQAFGFGGLNDPSAPNKADKSFSNAPCARGVVFLLEGDTLFETLMLNFFSIDLEKDYGLPHKTADKPAWELSAPFNNDPKRPYGYLDYATWLNRKVLLLPEGEPENPVVRRMRYYVGMKRMAGNPLNPLMGLRPNPNAGKKKKDDDAESSSHLPLVFREERVLWRDSGPLFAWKDERKNNYIAPRAFEWIHSEMLSVGNIENGRQFFFGAYGICSESGKDKMYSFRAERFPLPVDYLKDIGAYAAKQLQLALQRAESTARILSPAGALGTFARETLNTDDKNQVRNFVDATGAERYFWSRLEGHFVRLVQDLPHKADDAIKSWDDMLRQLARQGFEQAARVAGGTRALRAYGIAANWFDWQLDQVFNPQSAQPEGEKKKQSRKKTKA